MPPPSGGLLARKQIEGASCGVLNPVNQRKLCIGAAAAAVFGGCLLACKQIAGVCCRVFNPVNQRKLCIGAAAAAGPLQPCLAPAQALTAALTFSVHAYVPGSTQARLAKAIKEVE